MKMIKNQNYLYQRIIINLEILTNQKIVRFQRNKKKYKIIYILLILSKDCLNWIRRKDFRQRKDTNINLQPDFKRKQNIALSSTIRRLKDSNLEMDNNKKRINNRIRRISMN